MGRASATSPRCCGFVDVVQMLRQNQRLLRANRVRSLRGAFHLEIPLGILPNRRSHSPLQRTSVVLFGAFAWSSAALLRVEPRRRALSVGPPWGGSRRAEEVRRPPQRQGVGVPPGASCARPGARARAVLNALICSKPRLPSKVALEPTDGSSTTPGDRYRDLGARGGCSERTDPRRRSGLVDLERVEFVPGSGHTLEGRREPGSDEKATHRLTGRPG